MPDERPLFDATVRVLEDSLGADVFTRARERGSDWSLTEAVEAGFAASGR